MMIGIGSPISHSRIPRIVVSLLFRSRSTPQPAQRLPCNFHPPAALQPRAARMPFAQVIRRRNIRRAAAEAPKDMPT